MAQSHSGSKSRLDRLEETLFAMILGIMTLLTFANVVARYVFNSNIFWALELTVFLFAWLVLFGASYAIKTFSHLGVDALVNIMSSPKRRIFGIISALACIFYAALLVKGGWDYWAPYANLPPTEGRWIPTGFAEKYRGRGWYETQDIPVPFFLTWLETVFNNGETYEKLPKVVPYLVMPLAMLLLFVRCLFAFKAIWQGRADMMIVSHEAEDDVKQAGAKIAASEGR